MCENEFMDIKKIFKEAVVLPSKVRMVVMTEHTTDELHFLEVHVKLNQNCRAVHVLPARAGGAGGAACSGRPWQHAQWFQM